MACLTTNYLIHGLYGLLLFIVSCALADYTFACTHHALHHRKNRFSCARHSHFTDLSSPTRSIDRSLGTQITTVDTRRRSENSHRHRYTDIPTQWCNYLLCLCACVCASTSVQEGGWKMRGTNTLYLCKYIYRLSLLFFS